MNKKHLIIVGAVLAGYFAAGTLAQYPGFSHAFNFGAGLKN